MTRRAASAASAASAAVAVAVLVLSLIPTRATLLAASTLEACTQGAAGGALTCASRLSLALTVQNGENATSSVQTYRLASATSPTGQVRAISVHTACDSDCNCHRDRAARVAAGV